MKKFSFLRLGILIASITMLFYLAMKASQLVLTKLIMEA